MSLRARLLAATLALVACGLVAADVATYSALRAFLYDRVDSQLEGANRSVLRILPTFNFGGGRIADISLQQLRTTVPGVFVQVLVDGQPELTCCLSPDQSDIASPRLPDQLGPKFTNTKVMTLPGAGRHAPRYRTRLSALPDGSTLVVAIPLTDTTSTLHRLLGIELFVTLFVFALAAGTGLWLVRLGLRPLGAIEETAAAITAGHLSTRVSNDDERTEVGRLGRVLNVMLERIDTAFRERRASEAAARASEQRVRRFVADASHELRTPVAAVRAYAELYRLGADQHPEDLARLLARIEEEAARMGVLVDDLLLLTRLDEGRPLEQAPVDLGAVAADAVEAARALDPERPIDLAVDGSVEVLGDRDRLRQVADNLLANVRAHTPAAAPARVHVFAHDHTAVLEVADRGPGLGEHDAGRVFERFYRADESRSRDSGGAGLGLSIVAAIAGAHGGRASAADRIDGGAVFRVHLPVLDEVPS